MRSAYQTGLLLALSLLLLLPPTDSPCNERYDAYHTVAEVAAELAAAAEQAPEAVTIIEAGTSAGGHPIQVARVARPGPIQVEKRPAVFVGGNVCGHHHSGTEAALHLLRTLLDEDDEDDSQAEQLLRTVTFYIAPVLNPDAHDTLFAPLRWRRSGNQTTIDHDVDGLLGEDGGDDLDGDGRITSMRIADPSGEWLPHPDEPRLLVRQDAAKGWIGRFRLESEGNDDDGDGAYNEDGSEGIAVDRNFPHAFPYPDPGAGPWASAAPETRAILDFLFARPQVAVAVVFGPANNLLAAPQELGEGGSGLADDEPIELPEFAAKMLGFDPEQEYTLNEIWEVAKESAFVRRHGISREQMAQFLGAGPATKPEDDDLALLKRLATSYQERLEQAGLDSKRPAAQYGAGGMTPWLYYQYGALALELDVWGIPAPQETDDQETKGKDNGESLTLDRLEKMTGDELVALDRQVLADFLQHIGAPPQMTAEAIVAQISSGQLTPQQMAMMARQQGAGGKGDHGDGDRETARQLQILSWLDQHDPKGFAPWTEVTLADGTRAEVGGIDPFLGSAPPPELLDTALQVHTEMVLDLAGQLARVELVSLEVVALGGGVHRVEAVAANRGALPTHTRMAARTQARLPVLLELQTGNGVELVTGRRLVTAERLDGLTGTVKGQWLVRAQRGATVSVTVRSDAAGEDSKTITITGNKPRGASR